MTVRGGGRGERGGEEGDLAALAFFVLLANLQPRTALNLHIINLFFSLLPFWSFLTVGKKNQTECCPTELVSVAERCYDCSITSSIQMKCLKLVIPKFSICMTVQKTFKFERWVQRVWTTVNIVTLYQIILAQHLLCCENLPCHILFFVVFSTLKISLGFLCRGNNPEIGNKKQALSWDVNIVICRITQTCCALLFFRIPCFLSPTFKTWIPYFWSPTFLKKKKKAHKNSARY